MDETVLRGDRVLLIVSSVQRRRCLFPFTGSQKRPVDGVSEVVNSELCWGTTATPCPALRRHGTVWVSSVPDRFRCPESKVWSLEFGQHARCPPLQTLLLALLYFWRVHK